jgi:thiol:disulfide interchange protein
VPPVAKPERPGWSDRTLARGAPLAFLVGIVLNIIPGVLPLVALKDIVELDYSAGATVALIVGFYLVMFLPAEVPLVSYVAAPAETAQTVADLRGWISRNARPVAVVVLNAIGLYLVVHGIVSLVR